MNKNNWTYKKLVDECDILYGYPFNSKSFSTSEEDMPLVRIRDVKEGRTSTFFKGDYPQEYIIHKGDYLIGMDGEFNISPWKSADALLNQRVCKISCKTSNILMRYVYRFLVKELKKIEDETPFVTVKHLSAKKLNQIKLPIPPLVDQERIVAELDLLSSIIEKKKAQLKELDQLAQSIFYDMFGDPITNEKGWEVKTIGDFVNVKGGFAFKSNGYTQSGVRLVQIANVWKDNLKWDDIVFVSNENANNCSDYLLNKGDIVMAMTRPIIKSLEAVKIAVVSEEDLPCILNQRVCKFDLHNGLNSIWLYQFLRLPFFKNKIDLFGSKGMQPNVSSREIESIPLFLPPIHLQEIFADKVEAIKRQKTLIQQSIDEVQTMFDYTMDKYFG